MKNKQKGSQAKVNLEKIKSNLIGMYLKFQEAAIRVAVWTCAISVFLVLIFLVGYILVKGVPHLKPSLFSFKYNL